MPRADLPFDDEFLAYAHKTLMLAGIPPDREWLAALPAMPSRFDFFSEQRSHYDEARKAVPVTNAHWEQAAFMLPALLAAIWDLQSGKITSFAQFSFLYERLLGERSRRVLPMLFAAACLSPSLDCAFGYRLLGTLPDELAHDDGSAGL